MKNVLLSCFVILVIAIGGCSKDKPEEVKSPAKATQSTQTVEETAETPEVLEERVGISTPFEVAGTPVNEEPPELPSAMTETETEAVIETLAATVEGSSTTKSKRISGKETGVSVSIHFINQDDEEWQMVQMLDATHCLRASELLTCVDDEAKSTFSTASRRRVDMNFGTRHLEVTYFK